MGHSVALAPNGHVQVKTTRLCVHIKCTILDSSFFDVTWRIPVELECVNQLQTELWLDRADDPAYARFFSANCERGQFSFGQWPHDLSTRCNSEDSGSFQPYFSNYGSILSWCVCLPHWMKKKYCLWGEGGFSKKINCHAKVWGHYPPLKEITTLMHQGCIILTKSESVTVNTFIVLQKICFK